MSEYLSLKHMRLVDEDDSTHLPVFYLPHHGVLQNSGQTTKLRVVFDASAKSDTGVSLNDALIAGPVIQQDLISILLRFRTFIYVFTADVVKMYRQIRVHKSQTSLQRIVWRDSPAETLETYELETLTYGTSPASYLATRCIKHLAEQEDSNFAPGSQHIIRDSYVDDILTGADTLGEVEIIRKEVTQLLIKGCFELGKWASNYRDLSGTADMSDGRCVVDFNKGQDSRVLGIRWDCSNDSFHFKFDPNSTDIKINKRSILSVVAKIFDPLGLIGPVIIISKLIIQELWQLGIDWDESIACPIHTRWCRFKDQLASLNDITIPRCVKGTSEQSMLQLHGFCDASQQAYGACVYLRSQLPGGGFSTILLCSKSRVAPLKTISLPRLELCAAVLLAQLIHKVEQSLGFRCSRRFLWSDSTITLNWISSHSRRWTVFVANRVGEIQGTTDISDWRHVSSQHNPADVLSRGMEPTDLIDSELWWHGPSWLQFHENSWPNWEHQLLADMPEERKIASLVVTDTGNSIAKLVESSSSLNKICRVLAYALRFITAVRTKTKSRISKLACSEIRNALHVLCKSVQATEFSREVKLLSNGKALDSNSKLLSLSPFIDKEGLLRVGGRLMNSNLSDSSKHQILLPKQHRLTRLIIEFEHTKNLHSGVQLTIASVRQRFWPISAKSTTRKIVRDCVICFKCSPVTSEAIMGQLPTARVTESRAFSHTGVDYAGPFTIKDGKRRNSHKIKAYLAIFVCFATKAVHLELVSDLTTASFLGAFKRFISRRGKAVSMHSDNGTVFVGARNELKEFFRFFNDDQCQNKLAELFRESEISWNFIPPNAPHFGGLWESAVKSAKLHMRRVVGNVALTFEELTTVFCEIEAILNSRPITPMSEDPNDLLALTPGHFLIGEAMNSFPRDNLESANENYLKRWQRVEQLRQQFWRRWSVEYLNNLQERGKWRQNKGIQLEVGQLVLIKQPGLHPYQWLMGRIQEVHPGADLEIRSATVRTSRGILVRPLSKLAILPVRLSAAST